MDDRALLAGRLGSTLARRPMLSGGLQDGLDLQVHLDLVSHDHPAAVQGHADVDPEVAATDLGLSREAGAGATPRVTGHAVELQGEGDRTGHAVERQLTVDHEV